MHAKRFQTKAASYNFRIRAITAMSSVRFTILKSETFCQSVDTTDPNKKVAINLAISYV
jgi:hypothetical protein